MSSPEVTAEAFLRGVLRGKLMERADLQSSLRAVPKELRDDPSFLAEHLVRTGKLTRFQVGKLLRGVYHGLIIGPFRVLAPLGKGGMGTVFLVRDVRDNSLAALKILPPRLAREPRMLARFQREMDMCRHVTAHPNLARAYDMGDYLGVHFIAMEYIPGRTLSRLIHEEGPLPYARAARLFAEVAAALHHAHGQGLIHRDLKPSNILVTPRDHAKVVDLGLALMHGETGEDATIIGGKGYIVGTMDYIAPEQTTDAATVGPRGDLYSLGCTLYYALTGQPPFPGGTSKEKVMRHRNEIPTPLASLQPGMPSGFVELVERLMSKDPNKRPANAAEAQEFLQAWSRGEVAQPLDVLEEVDLDTQLYRPEAGSTEYSLVSLPEVEILEEVPDAPMFPMWLVILLAIGGTVLLLGLMIALISFRG